MSWDDTAAGTAQGSQPLANSATAPPARPSPARPQRVAPPPAGSGAHVRVRAAREPEGVERTRQPRLLATVAST